MRLQLVNILGFFIHLYLQYLEHLNNLTKLKIIT